MSLYHSLFLILRNKHVSYFSSHLGKNLKYIENRWMVSSRGKLNTSYLCIIFHGLSFFQSNKIPSSRLLMMTPQDIISLLISLKLDPIELLLQLLWIVCPSEDKEAHRNGFLRHDREAGKSPRTGWEHTVFTRFLLYSLFCNSSTVCDYNILITEKQTANCHVFLAKGKYTYILCRWKGKLFQTITKYCHKWKFEKKKSILCYIVISPKNIQCC